MDENLQKEEFSLAYVRAVATVAGYHTTRIDYDADSVDLNIAHVGARGTSRSPKIDVQAKCTSRDIQKDQTLNFPLPVKNYEDLRADSMVPRILIVVTVPNTLDGWLVQSEEELILRHCAYWISLKGSPPTDNTATVTVPIPRSQVFSPMALQNIMASLEPGAKA